MKSTFLRWRAKSARLNESLLKTLILTIREKIYFLSLPIFLLLKGKRFDFFEWKTLDVLSIDFWNPRLDSSKRELQSDFLWGIIELDRISSVLELGSLSGYRLFDLAEKYPNCKFSGVDISVSGVVESRLEAERRGLSNLEFFHLDITSDEFYELFKNRHFDVVFSFATLMYIHPTEIRKLIQFICRLALNQVVLLEQSTSRLTWYPFYLGVPVFRNPNWIRNYRKILLQNSKSRNCSISEFSVPDEIWSPGGGHALAVKITFL